MDRYSAFRENVGQTAAAPPPGSPPGSARGIRRVFVCGLARDFCVRWSALDAAEAGFETVVLDDLTRAVFPARRAEVDASLAAAG